MLWVLCLLIGCLLFLVCPSFGEGRNIFGVCVGGGVEGIGGGGGG